MVNIGHYINGKNIDGRSGIEKPVFNPATGTSENNVSLASVDEVNNAVASSKLAWKDWSNQPPLRRARILDNFKYILNERRAELARSISAEHGKTHEDALGEVTRGFEVVEFAVGAPHLLKGDYTENVGSEVDSFNVRQSLGVVAGITPFNFPAMVPMWMFPVAIACGNTFVLKPSEKDPSCSIKLAELFNESGLPDGVFNVVNGDKEAVDALLTNKDIAAISFVGSTPIAKYIYENAAKNEKRVQALGGAKNHCVVMPDCDLDQAVNGLMGAAYGSAGERCMAQSVVVAVGNVGDKLVQQLKSKVELLKVGPGSDKSSEMGPLVTKAHLEKVKGYVDLGIKEGAKLIVDGRNINLQGFENGFYIGGCLFDNVKPNMQIYKEEIFGPVLSVVRVKNFETAVQLVNDHEFGNGTSIYTRDGNTGRTYANQIKVGMVGINIPIPVPMAFHSFGGWKRSLFGDQHMHGPEGVRFYTKLKTITSRWPSGVRSDPEFIMPTMK